MGEGIAEADYGVVEIMHVPVQPSPIRLNGAQDVSVPMRILEGFCEHGGAAVYARDLEARLQKLHRVIPRACGDVQHLLGAVGSQLLDEELAFRFGSAFPV